MVCFSIEKERENSFFNILDNKLLTSLISNEPETVLALPDSSLPEKKYKIVKTLSDLYERQLVGIVDWAKRIPGKWNKSLNKQSSIFVNKA